MRQKLKGNAMRNKEAHYCRLYYSFFGIDRSNRHKINKDIDELNSTINQLGLTDTQNISFCDISIHVLLKLIGNIHQERPDSGP